MAGLFFAFSNTVMRALENAPADQGAAVMQSINAIIVNPVFLVLFLGTGIFHAISVGLILIDNGVMETLWAMSSGLLYLIGCLFITIKFNVPLNDRLAALDTRRSENADKWRDYLGSWVPWNHVRTYANIASTVLGCIALVKG